MQTLHGPKSLPRRRIPVQLGLAVGQTIETLSDLNTCLQHRNYSRAGITVVNPNDTNNFCPWVSVLRQHVESSYYASKHGLFMNSLPDNPETARTVSLFYEKSIEYDMNSTCAIDKDARYATTLHCKTDFNMVTLDMLLVIYEGYCREKLNHDPLAFAFVISRVPRQCCLIDLAMFTDYVSQTKLLMKPTESAQPTEIFVYDIRRMFAVYVLFRPQYEEVLTKNNYVRIDDPCNVRIEHTHTTMQAVRQWIRNGVDIEHESYATTNTRDCYRCDVHKKCEKCIYVRKNTQNEIIVFCRGLHSNAWNDDVGDKIHPFWKSTVTLLMKEHKPGKIENVLQTQFSECRSSGSAPELPTSAQLKNFIANMQRQSSIHFDEDEYIEKTSLFGKTNEKYRTLASLTSPSGKELRLFYIPSIDTLLKKLAHGKSELTFVGMADGTYKIISNTRRQSFRTGRFKSLVSFGFDILTWKNGEWVSVYVPVILGFTESESEWVYRMLFEYATVVFALSGLVVFETSIQMPPRNFPNQVSINLFYGIVAQRLLNANVLTSEHATKLTKKLDAVKKIASCSVTIRTLVSDNSTGIVNAAQVFSGGFHKQDYAHVKRLLTHTSKHKLLKPKMSAADKFNGTCVNLTNMQVAYDVIDFLRICPIDHYDLYEPFMRSAFEVIGESDTWAHISRMYVEAKKSWNVFQGLVPFHGDTTAPLEKTHDIWCRLAGVASGKSKDRFWKNVIPTLAACISKRYIEVADHVQPNFLDTRSKVPAYVYQATLRLAQRLDVNCVFVERTNDFYVNSYSMGVSKKKRMMDATKQNKGCMHIAITPSRIKDYINARNGLGITYAGHPCEPMLENKSTFYLLQRSICGLFRVRVRKSIDKKKQNGKPTTMDDIQYSDLECDMCEDFVRYGHCPHMLSVALKCKMAKFDDLANIAASVQNRCGIVGEVNSHVIAPSLEDEQYALRVYVTRKYVLDNDLIGKCFDYKRKTHTICSFFERATDDQEKCDVGVGGIGAHVYVSTSVDSVDGYELLLTGDNDINLKHLIDLYEARSKRKFGDSEVIANNDCGYSDDTCIICNKSTLTQHGNAQKDVLICEICSKDCHYRCSGLAHVPASHESFICEKCRPRSKTNTYAHLTRQVSETKRRDILQHYPQIPMYDAIVTKVEKNSTSSSLSLYTIQFLYKFQDQAPETRTIRKFELEHFVSKTL